MTRDLLLMTQRLRSYHDATRQILHFREEQEEAAKRITETEELIRALTTELTTEFGITEKELKSAVYIPRGKEPYEAHA